MIDARHVSLPSVLSFKPFTRLLEVTCFKEKGCRVSGGVRISEIAFGYYVIASGVKFVRKKVKKMQKKKTNSSRLVCVKTTEDETMRGKRAILHVSLLYERRSAFFFEGGSLCGYAFTCAWY